MLNINQFRTMKTLFTNIKTLVQVRENEVQMLSGKNMQNLPIIEEAYLFVEGDVIVDYGKMESCPTIKVDEVIDCSGKIILPTWIDSHTHIVYADHREGEFVDKIKGLSYEEIAAKGGGILNSAEKLAQAGEDELFEQAAKRVEEVIMMGTGALEIKSGYGLSTENELKMLRVIKRLNEHYPIPIIATFLGAHAFPKKYLNKPDAYIQEIITQMLPQIEKEKLAAFVDVFCEKNYFDLEQTERILVAAKKHGLTPKIHVNQFNSFGGVALGVKHKALSLDHLEVMTDADMEALKGSRTMPVALPGCSFFLGIPYTPTRKMIDAGLPIALATDYNPGSSPSGNMNFVVATACIKMKMTPEEAINAATVNAAYALGLSKNYGSISKGKKANFILTKEIPSYAFIPYSFGNNLIKKIFVDGKEINY